MAVASVLCASCRPFYIRLYPKMPPFSTPLPSPLFSTFLGILNYFRGDLANFSSISFLKSTSSSSILGLMYRFFLRGPQARAMMLPFEVRCSRAINFSRSVIRWLTLSILYDLVKRCCRDAPPGGSRLPPLCCGARVLSSS